MIVFIPMHMYTNVHIVGEMCYGKRDLEAGSYFIVCCVCACICVWICCDIIAGHMYVLLRALDTLSES